MKERVLDILCWLIFIVAACPIDVSALVFTDVTICNEYNEKSGIATKTERDRLGRVTSQITRHNRRCITEKEYIWELNDQLLSITNNGKQTLFEYDSWGNLAQATYPDGKVAWSAELDAYGDVRELTGERTDCPFRYQEMYFDKETNLCYNRYRYYSPETGSYISQDPIRLAGNNPTLYAYVHDPNTWLDPLGLECTKSFNKKNNITKKWVKSLSGKSLMKLNLFLRRKDIQRL